MGYVSLTTALQMVNSGRGILVDVRSKEEFEKRHLKGAINIPIEKIEYVIRNGEDFEGFTRDKWVIVYCEHGGSSVRAMQLLNNFGFAVLSLIGGIVEAMKVIDKDRLVT